MNNRFGDKIPDKLYKYMPWRWIDDKVKQCKRNYTYELIKNNEFYFQSPANFNDPFDAKIYPVIKGKNKVLIRRLKDVYAKQHLRLPHNIKRDIRQHRRQYDIAILQAAEKNSNEIGICCFTKSKKNILMWAHYAASHTGVCLEFTGLNSVKAIEYKKQYPLMNYLDNDTGAIMQYNGPKDSDQYWKF